MNIKRLRSLLLLLLSILIILTLSSSASETSANDIDSQAEKILENMTTEEKVGQLVMVSWSLFDELSPSLENLIKDYHIGSVYISGRNASSAETAASVTNQLQELNWEYNSKSNDEGTTYTIPLFLATDHEGDGPRLTRIREGMTDIPSPLGIGATWDPTKAESIGAIVGKELNSIGINMLLGPVLDVVDNPSANVGGNLDVRVFGGDPYWVGEMGTAFIHGVHTGSEGGVITVAKHFPGHGDSNRSVDNSIARTNKLDEELFAIDLVPFIKVTQENEMFPNGVTDAIMSSHIGIEATNNEPVSLYYEDELGGLIRLLDFPEFNDWYEEGFVVSDNLGVQALRNEFQFTDPSIIALDAFKAGNDLLILHDFFINTNSNLLDPKCKNILSLSVYEQLVCKDQSSHNNVKAVLDRLIRSYSQDEYVQERIDEAVFKIIKAKLLMYPNLSIDSFTIDENDVKQIAGQNTDKQTVEDIAQSAITLIKPSNFDDLPPKPEEHERILFVLHDYEVRGCEICGESWRNTIEITVNGIFSDRGFNNIGWINYYREDEETGLEGLSPFLHWNNSFKSEFEFELSEKSNEDIISELSEADWIIFLFIAGDCGPYAWDTSRNDNHRCGSGFYNEADVLHEFQVYKGRSPLNATTVALSFGAPPWSLDSTDVSGFDAYYAAFNQLEPFIFHASRAILQEYIPTGASPITVKGTDYELNSVLGPDPDQEISLDILNEPLPENWLPEDSIVVALTNVTDNNGNPLLHSPEVAWAGKYINDDSLLNILSSDSELTNGQANAIFQFEKAGPVEIIASLGNLESQPIKIDVLNLETPTKDPSPTIASIETSTPSSTSSPIETSLPTGTAIPVGRSTTTPILENTPLSPTITPAPTFIEGLVRDPVGLLSVILTFIGVVITAIIPLIISNRKKDRSDSDNSSNPLIDHQSSSLDTHQQVRFHQILDEYYDDQELRSLCMQLGIQYEDLPSQGQSNKARDLVALMARTNRMDELEAIVKEDRPFIFNGDKSKSNDTNNRDI